MQDLTRGSISRHLLALAAPMAAGMILQTLYYFVDIYFVAQLGEHAIAGVSAAGNAMFIVLAMTQVLGIGSMALISHAVGRKDQADANLIFNQSLVLAALCAGVTLALGYSFGAFYVQSVSADPQTTAAGVEYLHWFLPAMALQFAMVAMSSALRGTGIVKPAMLVQGGTVLINAALAPVLIVGWGAVEGMGVAGAGLASSLSVLAGVVMLGFYFTRLEKYVSFHPQQWQPRLSAWRRMLKVGLPSGGEFLLLFVYIGVTYWVIRRFGAAAQAGYGIGARVMQGIFLPAMAIAFAVGPVAGQNFGARQAERVRETLRTALTLEIAIMALLMLVCQLYPQALIALFSDDAEVTAVGAEFLRIVSWNFVATGIVFVCSGMFQALGNTVPTLLSSATRLFTFVAPSMWFAAQPDLRIEQIWYLSVGTLVVQTLVSLWFLRNELRERLNGLAQPLGA